MVMTVVQIIIKQNINKIKRHCEYYRECLDDWLNRPTKLRS